MAGEYPVDSFHVSSEMFSVRAGQCAQVVTIEQLIAQMKDSSQELRKGFVFEEQRIFEQSQKEVSLLLKKCPHFLKVHALDIHWKSILSQAVQFVPDFLIFPLVYS